MNLLRLSTTSFSSDHTCWSGMPAMPQVEQTKLPSNSGTKTSGALFRLELIASWVSVCALLTVWNRVAAEALCASGPAKSTAAAPAARPAAMR
jgi:hypothetical protein